MWFASLRRRKGDCVSESEKSPSPIAGEGQLRCLVYLPVKTVGFSSLDVVFIRRVGAPSDEETGRL